MGDAAEQHGNSKPWLGRHQWKPGQSGNPGGRPRGRSIDALLRQVLERDHNGKVLYELLAERLVKEALSGKLGHIQEVLDRVEVKVPAKAEIGGFNGLAMGVRLVMPAPRIIGEETEDDAS